MIHVCETCGAQFEPRHGGGNARWCPACRRAGYLANQRKYNRARSAELVAWRMSEAYACAGIGRNGCDLYESHAEQLPKAKSRPDWCSPARWRIELRRRARSEYYECCASERSLA